MIQLTVNRGGSAMDWTHTEHETLTDAFTHIPTDLGMFDTVLVSDIDNDTLYELTRIT